MKSPICGNCGHVRGSHHRGRGHTGKDYYYYCSIRNCTCQKFKAKRYILTKKEIKTIYNKGKPSIKEK
ncbi:hypothetical protein LCGC14_0953800 [marine sediment metagenome]|uniref:Uncharacterized protein n=1 Tax=marine sediment metagenome TaxID=412755 RepID=A0A0F9NGE5_9ZZZZ